MKSYIYASMREEVEKRLEVINRKAKRYGVPFGYAFGERTVKTITLYEARYSPADHAHVLVEVGKTAVEAVELTVDADGLIKKGGWTVIARLEHTEKGNIVTAFTDVNPTDTDAWHKLKPHCDHCGTNRVRNITYIVRNEDGETKQIGSSCLNDYSGIDPELAVAFAAIRDCINTAEATGDNYDEDRERGCAVYDTEDVLAHAIECIKLYGYHKAGSTAPTASAVRDSFAVGPRPSKESREKASKIAEWLRGYTGTWDLLQNCSVLSALGYCKAEHIGLLSYAPVAYERETERERERSAMAASEYVGSIGERITRKLKKAEYVTSFESEYGFSHLYRFSDDEGNVLVWFASSMQDIDGATQITGTIKKQEERNGVKQTVLTRCKVA